MTFKEWVEQSEQSPSAIAKHVGISRVTVYNYLEGKSLPSIQKALRIEEFTQGEVTLYDWARVESTLSTLI